MGALSDVSAERDRAVALLAGGRLEDAITHLRQSVELARTAGDDQAEGELELLLGRAYRSIGGVGREQDRRADRHVERAEAAFRRAGYRAGRLEALAELAVHAAEAGDDPGVEYFLGQAGQIDTGVAAWWQSYIAATSAMGHDPDGAAAAFLRCLETVDSLPRSAAHWRRECELKLAFLTGGDLGSLVRDTPRDRLMALIRVVANGDGDDLANTQSALEAAERMRQGIQAEAKQRELSATLDLFYTAAATAADCGGRPRDALDILELNTSRSLMSRAAMSWLWRRSPVQMFAVQQEANAGLIQALTLWEQTGNQGEFQRLETALLRRRQAGYDVEEELLRQVPGPHPTFRPETISTLEPRLRPDDAVVFFASSGPVYVVGGGRCERVATVPPDEAEAAATAFANAAAHAGQTPPQAEAGRLAALCVDPVRAAIGEARRVFVVPSQALWHVPLGAIGEAPLAAAHAVTYIPSLSMLGGLLMGEQGRRRRRVERFVGVADPDGSLPSAAGEVAAAASRFYDHAVAVGDDVAFVPALRWIIEADVVHIACHSGFFENFPEFSYLHLGGRGAHRGLLWAQDLARLSLRARLVVLAACHAGTSVALPGNEYVGLPSAFLAAGALTMVAPLWAVDDVSTARFMGLFYDQLADAGPAEALWRAQCGIRREPSLAHPYYWAGFQAFGLP